MRFDPILVLGLFGWISLPSQAAEIRYGFGHTPSAAEIAAFDIDIRPDGQGLPPGHGSVGEGAAIFASTCAACHGEKGDNAKLAGNQLAGGIGTLASAKPVKTIGSYWPYATTVFDYIHRAMPYTAPQSLSDDQVYALTAYLLSVNGIVPADTVLDAQTLPKVKMPNRDGFTPAGSPGTEPPGSKSNP
jgi:cytochrome c